MREDFCFVVVLCQFSLDHTAIFKFILGLMINIWVGSFAATTNNVTQNSLEYVILVRLDFGFVEASKVAQARLNSLFSPDLLESYNSPPVSAAYLDLLLFFDTGSGASGWP